MSTTETEFRPGLNGLEMFERRDVPSTLLPAHGGTPTAHVMAQVPAIRAMAQTVAVAITNLTKGTIHYEFRPGPGEAVRNYQIGPKETVIHAHQATPGLYAKVTHDT